MSIQFTGAIANIEYSRDRFHPEPPPFVRGAPQATGSPLWFGRIERRLPDGSSTGTPSFVGIAAQYADGAPTAVRCDANMDGNLANDSELALYEYPPIPGAVAAFVDLRWEIPREGHRVPVAWRIRLVLEPLGVGDTAPVYRVQAVYGRTGEVRVDGRNHRAFLYDGNRDGVYTTGFGDGMFVDLNDDGSVVVDLSTGEFLPFGVRTQLGRTVFETTRVAPDGGVVGMLATGGADPVADLEVGQPAPDFEIEDLDGARIRLGDFRGRSVIVYFWAGWCGACEKLAPKLRELYERYHPRGLEIIGVSFDDDRGVVGAFRDRHDEPWPTSYTGRKFWENPVGRIYGVRAAGAAYLVDAHGTYLGLYYDLDELDRRLAGLTLTVSADPERR